ncbi:hypothetical protein HYQ46_007869 [Verticillium longisporum]|nr:hypothetical protein HYQ46_007869 [Verticillium longisporum]
MTAFASFTSKPVCACQSEFVVEADMVEIRDDARLEGERCKCCCCCRLPLCSELVLRLTDAGFAAGEEVGMVRLTTRCDRLSRSDEKARAHCASPLLSAPYGDLRGVGPTGACGKSACS